MESITELKKALDLISEYTNKGAVLYSGSNFDIFKTADNQIDQIKLFSLDTIKKQYSRIILVLSKEDASKPDNLVDFVRALQKSYLANGGIIFLLILSNDYVLPRYIRTGADNLTKKVTTKTPEGKWPFQLFAFYN